MAPDDIFHPFLRQAAMAAIHPMRTLQSVQTTNLPSQQTTNQSFVFLKTQTFNPCHGIHRVTYSNPREPGSPIDVAAIREKARWGEFVTPRDFKACLEIK